MKAKMILHGLRDPCCNEGTAKDEFENGKKYIYIWWGVTNKGRE